jgi:hypothetical protein
VCVGLSQIVDAVDIGLGFDTGAHPDIFGPHELSIEALYTFRSFGE